MADASVNDGVTTPELSNNETLTFPVYIIHSKWSLLRLDDFLSKYGEVGFLRIIYDRYKRETDYTIAILPESSYNALCADGFNIRHYGKEVFITPYALRDNNFPDSESTNVLFIPVPKELSENEELVIGAINDKLAHLSEWNIIPVDSWTINAPLKSREKGVIRGGCFVSFRRDIPIESRAMVRVLITETYWPDFAENSAEERPIFSCFWAHRRKERTEPSSKKLEHQESPEIKESKKREAIQKVVKEAKPLKGTTSRKTATSAVPVTSQPTLK